jgi:hypothetical protein
MRAAKETQRDLEWTQKKVRLVATTPAESHWVSSPLTEHCSAMNRRAAERYPEQYRAANQRYPAPVDYWSTIPFAKKAREPKEATLYRITYHGGEIAQNSHCNDTNNDYPRHHPNGRLFLYSSQANEQASENSFILFSLTSTKLSIRTKSKPDVWTSFTPKALKAADPCMRC